MSDESILGNAREYAEFAFNEARDFLASETGRKLRHYTAMGLMMAVPAVASLPVVRKSKLAKLIELGGGAALIATVAEKIRDWEPNAS
ncbi:MAG: hypothetical protein ABR552_10105 [Actinomycetota bacterium]|nr:hypothetical protein [Actinomycetota bacterium]